MTGMTAEIEDFIAQSDNFQRYSARQQNEPMMRTDLPNCPWQIVSSDLFICGEKEYMVTVDCYSNFIEVDRVE